MKKIILTLAVALCSVAAVWAQPRAIGARLTYGFEASYQHSLSDNFIQADLGFNYGYYGRGLTLAGTHNWVLCQPKWTSVGTWDFYAGVGAGLGLDFGGYYYGGSGARFGIGAVGNVGLSYTFKFPLQLAVEERPILGISFGRGGAGFWGTTWYPALAVRYAF